MDTPNILFAGDPHGDFKPVVRAVRQHRPDAVVLLGDYDLDRPLEQVLAKVVGETSFWWIPGNHEGDRIEYHDHLFCSALADRNLDGVVREVAGVRIAGLGGRFVARVWHPGQEAGPRFATRKAFLRSISSKEKWRGGVPLRYRTAIWFEDYERLFDQRADVLVTHEAPGCHRHGHGVFDDLAQAMGAKLIVHGHTHEDYKATLSSGIDVIGVGRAGVTTLEGKVVSAGKARERKP